MSPIHHDSKIETGRSTDDRKYPEQVDQEVSSPSTLGKSDELEDFGPGGDFKMNPFI